MESFYFYIMEQLDLFGMMQQPEKKKAGRKANPGNGSGVEKEKISVPKKEPLKRGRKSYKEIFADVALLDIPADEILFTKQYYPINEVAAWFCVNPSVLRLWEKNFSILKPKKNGKGDRYFRPEDVKNIRLIYYLLRQQKFSVEGAKQYLKENHDKATTDMQLVETLTKLRSFLSELGTNLDA